MDKKCLDCPYAGQLTGAAEAARVRIIDVIASLPLVECRDTVAALTRVEGVLRAALSKNTTDQPDALKEMEARKDAAYEERNRVVAALAWMAVARGWKAGIAQTAIEGWSEDWHGCVYIDLPTGQVSWHFHDSHAALFFELPEYDGAWDGHDTPEKYRRVAALRPEFHGVCNSDPENLRGQLADVKALKAQAEQMLLKACAIGMSTILVRCGAYSTLSPYLKEKYDELARYHKNFGGDEAVHSQGNSVRTSWLCKCGGEIANSLEVCCFCHRARARGEVHVERNSEAK